MFQGSAQLAHLNVAYNLLTQNTTLVGLQALRDSLDDLSLAYNPLGDLCQRSTSERQPYGEWNYVNRKSHYCNGDEQNKLKKYS